MVVAAVAVADDGIFAVAIDDAEEAEAVVNENFDY